MGKTEQTKSTDTETKKASDLFFETFIEAMKKIASDDAVMKKIREEMEIKHAISPFLDDIKNIIETDPTFRDMPLNEIVETKEFKEIFKQLYETKYEATMEPEAKKVITALTLNPSKVLNYLIPNTKVANQLTTGNLYGKEVSVVVNNKSSKTKEVTTKVILNFEGKGITLSGRYELNAYDRIVHNTLISLKLAGNKTFTPAMVYRTMNGLIDNEKVRPETLEKVTESIDKLSGTRATIDFTDEAKMYRKDIKSAKMSRFLIEVGKVEIKTNAETVSGYEFISDKDPILYTHAQISGQVYSVPTSLLQTKENIRGTEEVIIIREYLIRQIEWIKSEKVNRSQNITYQGIYEELKITSLQSQALKDKSKAVRDNTKKILEVFKNHEYIKSFEEYKDGKTIRGIKIVV